jgi:GNAT superfamily N-acetyltransferase
MKAMNVVPLNANNPQHTRVVLALLVQSTLDYGDMDGDIRLNAWRNHQGYWAAAVDAQGYVAGIVCVMNLSDTAHHGLLWLEVLPKYQQCGVGKALLRWAQGQSHQALVIRSVPRAAGFYAHCA